MDRIVSSFLQEQNILTISTSDNNISHSATCFYSFLEEKKCLIFKSSPHTRHVREGLSNNNISGTIIANFSDITKIKGIQFQGKFIKPDFYQLPQVQACYYLKFPFALAMKGELWAIELEHIKMTDNTLGFGKKLTWEKKSQCEA